MLLDAWTLSEPVYKNQIQILGSESLLNKQALFQPFLEQTYHYISTQAHLLVHAGFDFRQQDPFLDVERMMMIREMDYVEEKAKNRTVVRGHYPLHYQEIVKNIQDRNRVISLDNGCVYAEREGMGNLLALELNSYQLIVQKNVD